MEMEMERVDFSIDGRTINFLTARDPAASKLEHRKTWSLGQRAESPTPKTLIPSKKHLKTRCQNQASQIMAHLSTFVRSTGLSYAEQFGGVLFYDKTSPDGRGRFQSRRFRQSIPKLIRYASKRKPTKRSTQRDSPRSDNLEVDFQWMRILHQKSK